MSYCRKNGEDSDVYLFLHVGGWLECCGCNLDPEHPHYIAFSRIEMIKHLGEHRKQGDKVPERAFDRLRRELRMIGDDTQRTTWDSGLEEAQGN